ncbi:MAG: YgfZ/GcvT domain-containing protein [Burkholderiales bacterium]
MDKKNIAPQMTVTTPASNTIQRDLPAAREAAVACPLVDYEFLRIQGEEAQSFLQGQLTNDVLQCTPRRAQFGGYCSPQGRLLANFLLICAPEGYLIHLPSAMASSLADRLRKFVLRARVKIDGASDFRALGLAGPAAGGHMDKLFGAAPSRILEVVWHDQILGVRLPDDLFLVAGPADTVARHRERAASETVQADTQHWDWLQIHAGIPWVLPPTRDQFIPQMVGLDAIGGVGFQKGCYPGQEIVARSQYLGHVKRRLWAGSAEASAAAGDALFAGNLSCGMVLNVAPAPQAGWDLLAVVQESLAGQVLHLKSGDGARVHPRPLPPAWTVGPR